MNLTWGSLFQMACHWGSSFYGENLAAGKELFELDCGTANPKCPALPAGPEHKFMNRTAEPPAPNAQLLARQRIYFPPIWPQGPGTIRNDEFNEPTRVWWSRPASVCVCVCVYRTVWPLHWTATLCVCVCVCWSPFKISAVLNTDQSWVH